MTNDQVDHGGTPSRADAGAAGSTVEQAELDPQIKQAGRMRGRKERSVRSRGRIARSLVAYLGLVVIAAVAGGSVALVLSGTTYSAEARLAVRQQPAAAAEIAGYPSAIQALASEYARYIDGSDGYLRSLEATSNERPGEIVSLVSSPIPSSSVIRVIVVADSQSAAVGAAKVAADDLLARVNAASPNLQQQRDAFASAYNEWRIAAAEAEKAGANLQQVASNPEADPAVVQAAFEEQESAIAEEAVLNLNQQALGGIYREAFASGGQEPPLVVLEYPTTADDDRASRLEAGGVGGAGIAFLLVAAHALWARRRRSDRVARTESDVLAHEDESQW